MENPHTSSRGPRRRGRRGGGRYRSNRPGQDTPAPRKKKNPILAFFSKLFGGKSKPANGSASSYRSERASRPERGERPDRPERERSRAPREDAPVEPREPRSSASTAAALADPKPEVTNEKLYIGNLSYDASESDLFDLFSKVGEVGNVEIVRDKSGRSKGFGFVVMSSLETAQEASAQLHRTEFMGRPLVVAGSKK